MSFCELDITDDFLEKINKNPEFKIWLLVDHNTAGNPVYPVTIYLSHITDGFAQFLYDIKEQYNELGGDMEDIYRDCGSCIVNKHPVIKFNRERYSDSDSGSGDDLNGSDHRPFHDNGHFVDK
ncbi:hypothetical protein SUVZ_13G4340 [Saccharomyces uvarum]|uniref:Uncharacterized protein n=1 Tax=Saccharomyces uvarum TaxID=230603 RepID=A0ABN8WIW2_SACUV|nr:hypothetical protein SUVZ_13G4340 [Saccharomyces uvarum]